MKTYTFTSRASQSYLEWKGALPIPSAAAYNNNNDNLIPRWLYKARIVFIHLLRLWNVHFLEFNITISVIKLMLLGTNLSLLRAYKTKQERKSAMLNQKNGLALRNIFFMFGTPSPNINASNTWQTNLLLQSKAFTHSTNIEYF